MGDTIACISSLSQKVLSALFTVQIIFHITTVKKTVRGLKALGYLFSIFWTCILAIKGHRMLLSQTSREDAFILQARNTHGSQCETWQISDFLIYLIFSGYENKQRLSNFISFRIMNSKVQFKKLFFQLYKDMRFTLV